MLNKQIVKLKRQCMIHFQCGEEYYIFRQICLEKKVVGGFLIIIQCYFHLDIQVYIIILIGLYFWGIEYDLMLYNALIWSITFYWWKSEALSAILTYLFARLLQFFRKSFGEGNIALKTNVDRRFLI